MKEKIQKWCKCLWVIWKDIRCWFFSFCNGEYRSREYTPKPNGIILIKLVKQSETTFFALSTTRAFSGFNLFFSFFTFICTSQTLSCPSATYQSVSDTDTWQQHLSPHYILLLLALANSPKTPNLESVGPQSPIYPYTFFFFFLNYTSTSPIKLHVN